MSTESYVSVYRSASSKQRLLDYYDRILGNWPTAHHQRVLETPSGRTHVITCGNQAGRPLILFHGTGNNSLMWRNNVIGLGQRFCLHLIDTLNDPGKSEASVKFNPQTDYAHWVTEVLDALAIQKGLLVGHSKGGWIVLNTAVSAPSRVERMVLLAPAVGINSTVSAQFMRRSLRLAVSPTPKAVEAYLRYVSAPGAVVNREYAGYLSQVIRGTKHAMIKHRRFTDEELRGIEVPVLLMFGDREVCVDYQKVVERARDCIRELEVRIVAGAGHALQGEKPEIVEGFITDHVTR